MRRDAGLWAVADGLGGHTNGDYASQLIVARLDAPPRTNDVCNFVDSIDDTMNAVNAELRTTTHAPSIDVIASTRAVLVYVYRRTSCGWVGDSFVPECARIIGTTH